jgi:hypothetical protein
MLRLGFLLVLHSNPLFYKNLDVKSG